MQLLLVGTGLEDSLLLFHENHPNENKGIKWAQV